MKRPADAAADASSSGVSKRSWQGSHNSSSHHIATSFTTKLMFSWVRIIAAAAAAAAGMPLPDVGGNLLLPAHAEHPDSSSGTMLCMLHPYFNCSNAAANPAAAAAGLGAFDGPPPGLAPHQLPVVSGEALTFALLGAWGAAPKMTCLISTVGGAAAAAAAAAAREAHHEQQHGQQRSGEGQQP
jgi:hypothetical protein